jgi:hypothetical protein
MDLGEGAKPKGFSLIEERGWATKEDLELFKYTSNKVHRHWDENRPDRQMNLHEARIMSRRIVEEWVAECAGL